MVSFFVYILSLIALTACNASLHSEQIEQVEHEQDYAALVEFYNAMGGEEWINSTNWCSDLPLEQWYGVYTHQGRVYAIDLAANNLSGNLPRSIASLSELKYLNLASNSISGSIPQSYGELSNLVRLSLYNNRMSGDIPAALNKIDGWRYNWGYAVYGNRYNRFNLYDCGIKAPELELASLSGEVIQLDEAAYARSRYTILFQFSDKYLDFIPTLKALYEKYHPFGLEIISWCNQCDNIADIIAQQGIEWSVALVSEEQPLSRYNDLYYPVGLYPTVTMFDSEANLVFSDTVESRGNIVSVLDERFADIVNPDLYTSTDYSADGAVTMLQQAVEGRGIDIVLMGDGFSDRMVADGRYQEVMIRCMEAMFSEAPFSHFRELFNIYMVTAVSANECFEYNSTTALRCKFGEGTLISGDNERCFDYVADIVTEEQLDDTLIVVVLNSDKYAGTTYMYHPRAGVFGSGTAIAYVPLTTENEIFRTLVCHEAVGHGFAKLDDEYILEGMGAMPADNRGYRAKREAFGWLKNTDVYHSHNFVKWSHFLSLQRYIGAGVGVFEGAASYASGVYRPTEQSIMNQNIDGFNPPSREAIYQRIHSLAYGNQWSYDFEKFKEYDFVNLLPNIAPKMSLNSEIQSFTPTHSPIIQNNRCLYKQNK